MSNYNSETNIEELKNPDGCATGREEDCAIDGIYINTNKVSEFVIYNTKTGEYRLIDNWTLYRSKMKKRIKAWADCVFDAYKVLGGSFIPVQLSYANNSQWQPKQLTDYLQLVTKDVGRDNVYGWAWAFEIKPIGRNLHYHLMLYVKSDVKIKMPDKSGQWSWGSSTVSKRSNINPYYLVKSVNYYTKADQKIGDEFPRGSRKYGVWVNREYFSDNWKLRKSAYPAWLVSEIEKDGLSDYDLSIERNPGGGWLVKNKNPLGIPLENIYFSPYVVYTDELHIGFYRDKAKK